MGKSVPYTDQPCSYRHERNAEAGSSDAMFALSVLFSEKMKPRDGRAAAYWYRRSVDAGHKFALTDFERPRWLKSRAGGSGSA